MKLLGLFAGQDLDPGRTANLVIGAMGQKHRIGNVDDPFMRDQRGRGRRIAQNAPAAQGLLPDEIRALTFGKAVELAAQLGLHRFGNALGNRVSDDHATISP